MEPHVPESGFVIDGPLHLPFPDRWRGRCWPDGCPRACTLGQKGDCPRGARPMRWTYIPAVGAGIWISRGGWRRVRSRCGACDTRLDARGATFAIADQGYTMEFPQRRVLAERHSASSSGPVSSALDRVGNGSTYP